MSNKINIYKTTVKLRLNKNVAGDTTQVLNEIRGISGVTTVIHLSDYERKADIYNFVVYEIKYELIGSDSSPISYIKKVLIPGIRDIQGINIQDTLQYLLKQDKFYEGTKWESHLFEVFPELEEFYDPMYKHNANLDLNIKKQEDIL